MREDLLCQDATSYGDGYCPIAAALQRGEAGGWLEGRCILGAIVGGLALLLGKLV